MQEPASLQISIEGDHARVDLDEWGGRECALQKVFLTKKKQSKTAMMCDFMGYSMGWAHFLGSVVVCC